MQHRHRRGRWHIDHQVDSVADAYLGGRRQARDVPVVVAVTDVALAALSDGIAVG